MKRKPKKRIPKDPVIKAIKHICKEIESYAIYRYQNKDMVHGEHLYSHVAMTAIKLANVATEKYQTNAQTNR